MAGTVTVASKLPMNLTLHLDEPRKFSEPTPLGAIDVTRYIRVSAPVVINGCARPVGADSSTQLAGGYALTHGVDAEFWAKWLETHKDYAPVARGSLFAITKADDATREAKSHAKIKSGFEPLDPENVPLEFTAGKAKIVAAA